MTEGNLSEQILFFSIPLMISNLLQALFNMADIAVVGQFSAHARKSARQKAFCFALHIHLRQERC